MDDSNLRGLSPEAARSYISDFLTSLKMTEQDATRVKEELATWLKRVELAASKAAVELESAARAKVDELTARLQQLEQERGDLSAKIARMREQLPGLAAAQGLANADQLLAELQMAVGLMPGEEAKPDPTPGLNALAADAALEELKRKMAGNS